MAPARSTGKGLGQGRVSTLPARHSRPHASSRAHGSVFRRKEPRWVTFRVTVARLAPLHPSPVHEASPALDRACSRRRHSDSNRGITDAQAARHPVCRRQQDAVRQACSPTPPAKDRRACWGHPTMLPSRPAPHIRCGGTPSRCRSPCPTAGLGSLKPDHHVHLPQLLRQHDPGFLQACWLEHLG